MKSSLKLCVLLALTWSHESSSSRIHGNADGVIQECLSYQRLLKEFKSGVNSQAASSLAVVIPEGIRDTEFPLLESNPRLYVSKHKRIAQFVDERCCVSFSSVFVYNPEICRCSLNGLKPGVFVDVIKRVHYQTRHWMERMNDDPKQLEAFDALYKHCVESRLDELAF